MSYDVAVIGAGVFGCWTAHFLRKAGLRVGLFDAYGPANSRSSSGGETRITRMAYGDDEIYSRWALESLPEWRALEERYGHRLFYPTGVLTFSEESTQWIQNSVTTIRRVGGDCELIPHSDLGRRFPQIRFKETECAVFEPESGALLSRHAVQCLHRELIREGVEYEVAAVQPPANGNILAGDKQIQAERCVFACGPWLPKLFPELLSDYLKPIRAEVFFLGVTPGTTDFAPDRMPT